MNVYFWLEQLDLEIARAAWIDFLKKGDAFTLNDETFEVITRTSKTFKIKSDKRTLNFKIYGSIIYSTKNKSFFTDVEGVLICDLINRNNQFHTPSDFLQIYQKNYEALQNT